ncbi:hypothetical protein [Borrelia sp. RT1S]|uniref:hypothetical protein n=1 Tax=unclassified Borrelia TaxID=2649934 RepID=UPI001E50BD2C|nr:hypothetical protein [Borrelia sp. RT1S]UGQ17226.1 hypothetical protein LSO05_02215 [Borrelia sp. RT1S]
MSDNLDTLMALMGQKLENNEKNENAFAEQELIIIESKNFEYDKLDKEISEFLRMKQHEIFNIFNDTYTEIGRILKEAQEKLRGSNQYDGLFYKWFTSMGFKKDKVYSLMSRYELLVEYSDKQLIINNLPLSLSYEISKKSCPFNLKTDVLNGKIKSLKEFKLLYRRDKDYEKNPEIKLNNTPIKSGEVIKIIELLLRELEDIKNIELDAIKHKELLSVLQELQQNLDYIKRLASSSKRNRAFQE